SSADLPVAGRILRVWPVRQAFLARHALVANREQTRGAQGEVLGKQDSAADPWVIRGYIPKIQATADCWPRGVRKALERVWRCGAFQAVGWRHDGKSPARCSEQLVDERLGLFIGDTQLAPGQWPVAIVEDRFEVFEAGKFGIFIDQADGDFLAPLVRFLQGLVEVGWVIPLLFENFNARIKPLVGIVLVVSDARAENVDKRKAFVSDGAF